MLPLARSLLVADVLTHDLLAEALFVSATRGVSLVRALLTLPAVDRPRLEQHLERGDVPYMRSVEPVVPLVQRLPRGLCERLLALPVRHDPRTGTVDVAVLDACDPHPAAEIAHWLKAPVRMVLTSVSSLDAALRQSNFASNEGLRSLAPPIWVAHDDQAPIETGNLGPELSADQNIPLLLTRRTSKPAAVAPADVTTLLDAIRTNRDRDAILELVLSGARTVAARVTILAVKHETLIGWTCSPPLADRAALRTLHMVASQTVFASVLDAHVQEGAHRVHVPCDAAHAALLSIWDAPHGTDVLVVSIRVDRRPVVIVVAEGLAQPTLAARRLEEISTVASASVGQALRRRRKH
jgi:hypothetical protein